MTFIQSFTLPFTMLLAMAHTACLGVAHEPAEELAASIDDRKPSDPAPLDKSNWLAPPDGNELALPPKLQCVSQASRYDGEMVPSVWRIAITLEGKAKAQLARGPQFAHPELKAPASPTQSLAAVVIATTTAVKLNLQDGASIELGGPSPFFRGVLSRGGGAEALRCWNFARVVGSPWAQIAAEAVRARYHGNSGRCVGADGNEAHNDLPIDFVRETRFGECADLRGASLNDSDFGGPNLTGYNLRGAMLSGARLFFATLSGSFAGADLRALQFGHASILGSVDSHTRLPSDCAAVQSPWGPPSVHCQR